MSGLTGGPQAVLAASDVHYGAMNNMLMPGRAKNMGDGWETKRRRGPGHDWLLLRLGTPGHVRKIEIDTNHFKGNYPELAQAGYRGPKPISRFYFFRMVGPFALGGRPFLTPTPQ